jgi:hypothetical protein
MEPFRWNRGHRRREKGMLLPAVHGLGDQRLGRFPEQIFLGHASDFQRHRRATYALDDVMIQERHGAFNRVRHFHPVAKQIEDVIGQKRFRPEER